MIDNNAHNRDIEFWRNKANDFEYLYREQKEISQGYRKLLEEEIAKHKESSRCF
jgi:hypothetical protein